MAAPTDDKAGSSLHDLAVDASADIRQLATGLAHAGAQPPAVQGLMEMASKLDQLSKVLAQAPEVEASAKAGPGVQGPGEPPPGSPPGPATPGGPPGAGGPPPGPPSGLAPGAAGGPPSGGNFGPATQELHAAMQRANQR
jgi:hypothetical protein